MLLNKEAILGAADLKTEDIDVPEWGGSVRVRTMSGAERDALGKSMMVDGKISTDMYRVRLIARCIVGEDGAPMFTEADVAALNAKNTLALDRIFKAADALNTLSEGAVEEAEKN